VATRPAPHLAQASPPAPDGPGRQSAGDPRAPERPEEDRLRFETFLTNLSTTFVNVPADQVDSQIEAGGRVLLKLASA